MKKGIFIIVLTVLTTLNYSQNLLKGIVVDENSSPVSNAQVYINEYKKTIYTDQNGNFLYKTGESDTLNLKIFQYGYKFTELTIDLKKDKHVKIILAPLMSVSDDIIITATRSEISKIYAPNSVDLINFNKIQTGITSISDVFNENSNIYTKDYGGQNGIKTASIRGSSAEQVLVLIDGIRINSPNASQVDLAVIPSDFIKSVEISKGGSSSLYGTDAAGGVINIFPVSKENSEGSTFSAETGLGSYNLSKKQIGFFGKWNNGFILAGYSNKRSDGNFKYEYNGTTRERENSDFFGQSFFLKSGISKNPENEIYLTSIYGKTERGTPGSVGINYLDARQNDKININYLTWKSEIFGFKNRFQLFHNYQYLHYVNSPVDVNSLIKSYTTGVNLEFTKMMTHSDYAKFGINMNSESVKTSNYKNKKRDHIALFYTHTKEIKLKNRIFDKIFLYPSVRFDKYGNLTAVSPKIGFNISRERKFVFALRSSISKNVRVPSFNELFWEPGGNPGLNPEKSFSADAGYIIGTKKVRIEQSFFRTSYSNLIVWQPSISNPDIWEPDNHDIAVSKGMETQIFIKPVKIIDIHFSHIYNPVYNNKKTNVNYKKQIIYRPKELIKLKTTIMTKFLNFSFFFNRTGIRYFSTDNKFWLPGFSTFNLSLDKNFTISKTAFIISIKSINIFDKKYEMFKGYPSPGRQFYLNFKLIKGDFR